MEKMRRAAIYARVSTDGQSTDNQLRELRATAERHGWTVIQEYVDRGISGAKGREKRPAFNALWQGVVRKEFEVVMVWSVDRLGRSLQHLVEFLSELHAKRVDLFLHQQGLDTTSPAGKALFGMLGVFAEFERSIIQERVRAGIKRSRASNPGRLWGRKPYEIANPALVAKVQELRKLGLGMRPISQQTGVSLKTVWRLLQGTAGAAA
jgi:DNA invertase Pin-like site-specific DNA recombinase